MAREITSAVSAAVQSSYVEPIVLAAVDFDVPQYMHSGLGVITYRSQNYGGVGNAVTIDSVGETEIVGPAPISITVSGLNYRVVSQVKAPEAYLAPLTFRLAYRQSDGTLYSDAYVLWKGKIQRCDLSFGPESSIGIKADHDFAVVDEADGGRYTDEDQQVTHSGDTIFSRVHDVPTQVLIWGGGQPSLGSRNIGPAVRPRDQFPADP